MAGLPYVLLIAGHRSAGDGGSNTERQLTDDLAIAYRDTFRQAGYRAEIVQELETGDPRGLVAGGLTGLALATARWIRAAEEDLVLALDLHFNTTESAVHTIVPHNLRQDGRGQLGSYFVQGRVADDIAANNTLDVLLATQISLNISKIPGMRLLGAGKSGIAGVMLENETRVGADGSRLGMMGVSADQRMKAVRLTIEHGGTNDAGRIPDFFGKCARASLLAVSTVLVDRIPVTPPPVPDAPDGDAGDPGLLSILFGGVQGYNFNPRGPVSQLWMQIGADENLYPRLIDVVVQGADKYFIFSSGLVISALAGEPVRRVESIELV